MTYTGGSAEAAERATRALEHINAEIDEVAGDRRASAARGGARERAACPALVSLGDGAARGQGRYYPHRVGGGGLARV
eukprot:SAG11_NODE_27527_length_331_cov_3.051724_1_plen_77_part_10